MTDIEHFEEFENELGDVVSSPEWLIIRGQRVDGFAWDDPSLYLARSEPLVGFIAINGDLIHNVTEFTITDIPVEL